MSENERQKIVKRSLLLAGHRTSASLEGSFWDELALLAAARGLSLNKLAEEIDARRSGNLSSALRLYVLENLKAQKH